MHAVLVLTAEAQNTKHQLQTGFTVTIKIFIFQVLQELFAFGFYPPNQDLYQTLAVILQLIYLSETSRFVLLSA